MKQLIERFENLGFELIINEELMNAKCLKKNSKALMPKAFFWIRFRSMERLAEYCGEWISNKEKIAAYEAERKAKKAELMKNMNHSFKIGQVLYDSWGWEQTNIDFYQVVEVKPKSIKMQRIASKYASSENQKGISSMAAYVEPVQNEFIREPELKKINVMLSGESHSYYIKSDHGWINLYENRPVYSSWYA
jgi:hypothetical protein